MKNKFNLHFLFILLSCMALFVGLSSCNQSIQPVKQASPVLEEGRFGVYFIKKNNSWFQPDVTLELVQKELVGDRSKLSQSVQALFSGPLESKGNSSEKPTNLSSEIPAGSKIIKIEEAADKVVVNINEVFVSGGGSRTMLLRQQQLEKTLLINSNSKQAIYIQIEGNPLKRIGGEGLVVNDPIYSPNPSSGQLTVND